MSVYSGPEIPNNGLVFSIDAGNDKCHSRNIFLALGTVGPGSASDNNVSFPVNGTGTFVRLGYGQTFGGYTIQPRDVVYKYTLGTNGCHYHGFDTTIPAGAYATFSFDYFVSTDATNYGTNGNSSFLASFEQAFSNSISAPNLNQGVWQRVSFTSGPSGSSGNLRALLYPGWCVSAALASSGYILFKNPTVELRSYDTGVVSSRTSNTAVTDISGTGNNGTLTNGAIRVNDYFNFDGVDDMLIIPNNTALDNQAFTVSVWVKTNATTQYGFWFEKGVVNTQYSLFQESTNIVWRQYFSSSPGGAGLSNLTVPTATYMNTSNWFNVVGTFISGTRSIYINGNLVASDTQSGTVATNSGGVSIGVYGGYSGSRGYYFNGSIANVNVYNRALTAAEVKQKYNAMRGRFGL